VTHNKLAVIGQYKILAVGFAHINDHNEEIDDEREREKLRKILL
jgi:hypothetical protein